jgi:hypothetical protein
MHQHPVAPSSLPAGAEAIALAAEEGERSCRWLLRWVWIGFGVVALALAGAGWAADAVSPQGERTVYTASCMGGAWQGERCTGRLRPEARVRFKVSKERGEVTFWSLGDNTRRRLAPCSIVDSRNWVCVDGVNGDEGVDAAKSTTLAMSRGRTQIGSKGRIAGFYPVPKWRWWLLHLGIG